MSDSPRRESNPNRDSYRGKDGFKKRNSSANRRDGGKKFGEKKFGDKKFGDKKFGERRRDGERRFEGKGGERRDNNRRFSKDQGGHQRGGHQRRDAREAGAAAARGEGYRPSKGVAPELDTDVTGKELDFAVQRELRALEKENADTVAKHLVMAGRYLDIDPAFALEHASYAVKRAGRISAVREAAGVTAYVAENFEMSLRELRTHRRISGSNEHLPLLIDSERALGRLEKAMELAEESKNLDLTAAQRVEIALVVSGIKYDQGDLRGAIKALEIPELNPKRGFEYSPRLFSAYAALKEEDGKAQEAARWNRLARMTEAALGQGDFAEPEIFDIFGEADLFEQEEPSVDLTEAETSADQAQENKAEEAEVEAKTSAETEISEEQAEEENLVEVTEESTAEALFDVAEAEEN